MREAKDDRWKVLVNESITGSMNLALFDRFTLMSEYNSRSITHKTKDYHCDSGDAKAGLERGGSSCNVEDPPKKTAYGECRNP